MSTINTEASGRRRILFTDGLKRKTIRLGDMTARNAERVRGFVDDLIAAKSCNGTPRAETLAWLEGIGDTLRARLVAVGLTKPAGGAGTVADLLDRFTKNATVKPVTLLAYKQTTDSLRAYIGGRALESITAADADGWRKSIVDAKLAGATVAKRVRVAKAIFAKAVRWGLLTANPFADLRTGSQSNPERSRYVSRATIAAVLNACPDQQWRAVVALSRYAGLRCPSEIMGLRWADVNWERSRLTVRSPKTAGHEGHAVRVVPIGPDLRPILLTLFEQAAPFDPEDPTTTEAVIPRLHTPGMNLRTTLHKIINRAGEKPWPRLFHNLRASCACDWVERFPNHVVAGWLGHSPLIAATHYLQTRDAHFDAATGADSAAQNPAQSLHRTTENDPQPRIAGKTGNDVDACDSRELREVAGNCERNQWAILDLNQ
ncbi:MAG: site-specific integrase [Planctomycetes bacterium]|nr:site-specific integrase [Planctomycetota bacterium]